MTASQPIGLMPSLGAMLAKAKKPRKPKEPPAEAYKWGEEGPKRVPRPVAVSVSGDSSIGAKPRKGHA